MAHQRGRYFGGDFGRKDLGPQTFDAKAMEERSDSSASAAQNPYAANPFESHYFQSSRALKQNARNREQATSGQADSTKTSAAAPRPEGGYDRWLHGYATQRDVLNTATTASSAGDVLSRVADGDYSGQMDTLADATPAQPAETVSAEPSTAAPRMNRPGMASASFDAHIGKPVDPFARSGPKGYVRSDERLREEICESLIARPRLDVSDVSVTVADGKVMLDGSVPDRHTRFAIEDVVEDTWGVKQVDNRLRVKPKGGHSSVSHSGSLQ